MSTLDGRRRRRLPAALIAAGVVLALAGVLWFAAGLVTVIISNPSTAHIGWSSPAHPPACSSP